MDLKARRGAQRLPVPHSSLLFFLPASIPRILYLCILVMQDENNFNVLFIH